MFSEVISFSYILLKVKRKRKFRSMIVPTNGYEKNILKQAMPLTFEQLVMTITGYLEPLFFYYSIGKTGVDLYSATLYYTKVTSYAIPLLILLILVLWVLLNSPSPRLLRIKIIKQI